MARPSTYDFSKASEAIIGQFANGKGLAAVARELGVARSTIYRWIEEDPALSDIFEQAKDHSLAWWEDRMIEAAVEGKGNAALFKYLVNNKFRQDYSERQEIDLKADITAHELNYMGYQADEDTEDGTEEE